MAAPGPREEAPAWDGIRFGQSFDSARLYVFIAREAPVAAVLRRGPGRQTALLSWDLESDEVRLGQWVRARIYERRCDISPDGKFFFYFAAKHSGPLYSWSAISILPYFRACVLWQKGDCWGGGGLFGPDGALELNHPPGTPSFDIHAGHLPRPWRKLRALGSHPGGGEDRPIEDYRLRRDGWRRVAHISNARYTFSGPYSWITHGADILEKMGPDGARLHLIDDEHGERNGRSYLTECQIRLSEDSPPRSLGRVDWADWHGADLLFARNGCLWRLRGLADGAPRLVADLNAMRFEQIKAPYEGAGDRR